MDKRYLFFLTFFCTSIFYSQNYNKTNQERDIELRKKIENSVYFHKKWMLAKIKDNSVSLKYNAYNGEMVTPKGNQIFPSNGVKLISPEESQLIHKSVLMLFLISLSNTHFLLSS